MEEAHSKVEAEPAAEANRAAKAEQQCYGHGHKGRTKIFREFMETLAPNNFQQEGYFEAYVRYIEDSRQAYVEGKNSNMVDFIPLGRMGMTWAMERTLCLWMVRPPLRMVVTMRP